MTAEQALVLFQEMRPDHKHRLSVEHEAKIGYRFGDTYYLWDYAEDEIAQRLIVSEISWEDALRQAEGVTNA